MNHLQSSGNALLIPNEIYRGHHPALVTEAVFLAANRAAEADARTGIAHKFKVPELPLKSFAKAEHESAFPTLFEKAAASLHSEAVGNHGNTFTGYVKKGIAYYKSRGTGKAVNVNAAHLNGLFCEELRKYEYDEKHTTKLQERITFHLTKKLKDNLQEQIQIKKLLSELETKIDNLETRFVENEISKDLYDKHLLKYNAEKKELSKKLSDQDFNSSNLEKIVEKGLSIARNMHQLWHRSDFDDKRELQSLVFPDGILYNKEKDRVRTPRVNSVFASIPILTKLLEEKEIEPLLKNDSVSTKVEVRRVELLSKHILRKLSTCLSVY